MFTIFKNKIFLKLFISISIAIIFSISIFFYQILFLNVLSLDLLIEYYSQNPKIFLYLAFSIVIISYFLARIIVKPLIVVNKITNEILDGDFTLQIDYDKKDEIGIFKTNFNKIVEILQISRNELDGFTIDMQNKLLHKNFELDEVKNRNKIQNNILIQQMKLLFVIKIANEIDNIQEFLDLKDEKDEFFIDEIVMKSLEMYELNFTKNNITVDYNFSKAIKTLGSSIDFLYVMLNILSNSKKAFEENKIKNPKIFVSIKKDKDFAYINIIDNAGGISNDFIEDIPTSFVDSKEKNSILKTGLYISKIIIESNLEGNMEFENSQNGLKISIKIPIYEENL